jgi:hypothetical protein
MPSATQELCEHLETIAKLLEKGDPESAAAVVAAMNELYPRLPSAMPEAEAIEARRLLARCVKLEEELRSRVLASLKGLATMRKSMNYCHRGIVPLR